MPRPTRPLPSIRTDRMPRRASCAARITPENRPPAIATGTRRSDFIIGPTLRVRRTGLARLDMVVDAGHGSSARFGEPSRNDGVDEHCQARTDQLAADLDRAETVA